MNFVGIAQVFFRGFGLVVQGTAEVGLQDTVHLEPVRPNNDRDAKGSFGAGEPSSASAGEQVTGTADLGVLEKLPANKPGRRATRTGNRASDGQQVQVTARKRKATAAKPVGSASDHGVLKKLPANKPGRRAARTGNRASDDQQVQATTRKQEATAAKPVGSASDHDVQYQMNAANAKGVATGKMKRNSVGKRRCLCEDVSATAGKPVGSV